MNLIDGIRQEIAKEEINEFVFNKETNNGTNLETDSAIYSKEEVEVPEGFGTNTHIETKYYRISKLDKNDLIISILDKTRVAQEESAYHLKTIKNILIFMLVASIAVGVIWGIYTATYDPYEALFGLIANLF